MVSFVLTVSEMGSHSSSSQPGAMQPREASAGFLFSISSTGIVDVNHYDHLLLQNVRTGPLFPWSWPLQIHQPQIKNNWGMRGPIHTNFFSSLSQDSKIQQKNYWCSISIILDLISNPDDLKLYVQVMCKHCSILCKGYEYQQFGTHERSQNQSTLDNGDHGELYLKLWLTES